MNTKGKTAEQIEGPTVEGMQIFSRFRHFVENGGTPLEAAPFTGHAFMPIGYITSQFISASGSASSCNDTENNHKKARVEEATTAESKEGQADEAGTKSEKKDK